MEEIDLLHHTLRTFQTQVGDNKDHPVHSRNKFNKQFGMLLRDWNYLKIISHRIESTDSNEATILALDLKSLYVFGRVFSESVLYTSSLFVTSSSKIRWKKIGEFVDSTERNIEFEPDQMKAFWAAVGGSIQLLNKTFKYRNEVLHEKESNTEWTFAWPGHSNLDNVRIANVPWPEDADKKREVRTLNARSLLQTLANEVPKVFDYLCS